MSDAKTNWDTATAVYYQAGRQLEEAAYPYLTELVHKHYPTAVSLVTVGQMNEDFIDVLRVDSVILNDGTKADETDGDGNIDEDFEAMVGEVEEVLGYLMTIDPDEYLNETEIELGPMDAHPSGG